MSPEPSSSIRKLEVVKQPWGWLIGLESYGREQVGQGITTSVHGLLTVEAASDNALYLLMMID